MLEVSRANHPPDYSEVSEVCAEGSLIGFDALDQEAGQNGSDKSQPRPSSLEFTCSMLGDSVQLRVTLVFKSSDKDSAQWPEVLVGTYVIRPSEPTTLSELTRFGLEPWEVTLVSAKAPGSSVPTVSNKTSSLVVDNVDENRAGYKVFLRNTSQVAVAGVAVLVVGSNGVCDLNDFRGFQGPAIAPSETSELEIDVPKNEPEGFGPGGESCSASDAPKTDSGDSAKPPGSSAIIIDAVDFEDGTYEGDPFRAAMMECLRLGKEPERERIAALVEAELRNLQTNDSEKISSIQTKVLLPEEPDPALVRSTMERFSFLPASASASIQRDLKAGLLDQKVLFIDSLRAYEREVSGGEVQGVSLQQWWNATKGECDLLVPRYCENHR
jgi:hypothetical protein